MNSSIVITGEGIVSAIGLDKLSVLRSLQDGKTGIGTMQYLDSVHKELPVGEVPLSNEEMKEQLGISGLASRTALMGILAIKQAIDEAKIQKGNKRIVLISGTTVGGMDLTERYYEELVHGDFKHLDCLEYHDCGGCTQFMVNYFGIFSDFTTISTACSSAANALILGANLLKNGQADLVIAGGTEALSKFHLNGFNSLMILDKEVCRPFDATRAGLNLGEGAAFLVLETEESARQRDVPIHAYLNGYGNACDAFHQTATSENGEGAYLAMNEALRMAGILPSDVQYVNAHGTGTPNNDASESVALNRVFGKKMPLVSSTKSYTGHTTSASGSIESVISILALQHQFVPGNLGWKNPFNDGIIPTLGESHYELHHVLCNSFGFGGNDSALLFSDRPTSVIDSIWSDREIKVLSKVEINSEEELAEIKQFVKPLEARRMGKLMKSSLLSSLKALQQAGIQCPDAIITGTSMGCLENSELLLNEIHEQGEQMIKPTLFMQSTHNTISSNIAIRLKCYGYNTTYTQGDNSLEWSMRDAEMLLKSGKAKTVLVGIHDETTPVFRDIMSKLGKKYDYSIHSLVMVLSCGN